MANMTLDEAIYCMNSYLPGGSNHCYTCPYYASKHEDGNVYVCASSEAHRKAIDALTALKRQGGSVWSTDTSMTDVYVSEPVKYNGDYENYVWGVCKCCSSDKGIRMPRIRNRTEYHFKCKLCGTEGVVTIR